MNLPHARQVVGSLGTHPDAVTVFGDQYQTPDGATVITVSRPVGVFVIKGGQPVWCPAVDDTRLSTLAIIVGLTSATLAGIAMVRRPPWPDLRGGLPGRD